MAITLLRTAAGSAPSVGQYRAFQDLGLRVVAADCDPLSVGFAFANASYQVPRSDDPEYIPTLLRICEMEAVDWLMPSLDEELVLIATRSAEFEHVGTRLLISSLACLQICTDKLRTFEFFTANGIPTPGTHDGMDFNLADVGCYPQVVKPRSGRGSDQVFVARNEKELRFFLDYVRCPVVQTHIAGIELTIDVLSDLQARPLSIRPRVRIQTDSGISYKGATTVNSQVITWADLIARRLGLIGLANIQCFIDNVGAIWFTEVNARLAGSATLTFAADPGFSQALADLLAGKEPTVQAPEIKPLLMLRYWSEVYLDPGQLVKLCRKP